MTSFISYFGLHRRETIVFMGIFLITLNKLKSAVTNCSKCMRSRRAVLNYSKCVKSVSVSIITANNSSFSDCLPVNNSLHLLQVLTFPDCNGQMHEGRKSSSSSSSDIVSSFIICKQTRSYMHACNSHFRATYDVCVNFKSCLIGWIKTKSKTCR